MAELYIKLEFLAKAEGCDYDVTQVKEKFGTLRFYCNGTDIMHDCVAHAEQQSSHTCEECGAYGTLRRGGWLKTLCAKHAHAEGRELSGWEAGTLGLKHGEYKDKDLLGSEDV